MVVQNRLWKSGERYGKMGANEKEKER